MGDVRRRCSVVPLLTCALTVALPLPYAVAATAPAPAPSAVRSPQPVPGATLSSWLADHLEALEGLVGHPGLRPQAPPPGGTISPNVSEPAPSATPPSHGGAAAVPGVRPERDRPQADAAGDGEARDDTGERRRSAARPPAEPGPVPRGGGHRGAAEAVPDHPAPWSPAPVATEGGALADAEQRPAPEQLIGDRDAATVGGAAPGPVVPVLPLGAGLMSLGLGMAFLALRLRRG